ncbi:hypothetical protein D884_00228 [Pseudomonas sp. URMO17WK12:I10]|nr:hypothetical protein F633_00362 [Pseudomonas sp. LAMO17WK12:I3]RED14670.1 hypothetical protein D884_00228 [Pseudomonas sp. URMO17WK12:I10]SOD07585.1 hypothetical protein SAMN05660967_01306 [Pseudomonas sp. URMO17WK12:I9]
MSIDSIIDFAQAITEAERYRPAAEKVLKGEPDQAVYNHYASPCGQFAAGVWEGKSASGRSTTPSMSTAKSCRACRCCVTKKAPARHCVRVIGSSYPPGSKGHGKCWSLAARSMHCSSRSNPWPAHPFGQA